VWSRQLAAQATLPHFEHLAAARATLSESKTRTDDLAALLAEERAALAVERKKVEDGLVQIAALSAKQR